MSKAAAFEMRAKGLFASSVASSLSLALAAAGVACAPAAAPILSPAPAPPALDVTHESSSPDAAIAVDDAGTELVPTANLPPLPAPPPRVTLQPLVADEMPTAFCPLGIVAVSPPPPVKSRKKRRSERGAEHERDHDRAEHEARPYHAAPRIMIDVEGAGDAPALADLQRVARAKGYWPVRRCYESGLRRDQHLRGNVALTLSVDASGTVTAATSAPAKGTALADPVAAACVVRELALLSFAEPARTSVDAGAAGAEVAARVDVTLGTGDAPVFAAAPIPNAEAVREALRQRWPEATQCYARALEHDPHAGGRMDLHFRVAKDGRVLSVQEGDAHLAAADLASCVLDVYERATLPVAPRASEAHKKDSTAETALVYGLDLEPGGAN